MNSALKVTDRAELIPALELRSVSHRFEQRPDMVARVAKRLGVNVAERTVHAVDSVDLTVEEAKIVGLVGESGCGKSTLGRIATGLIEPTAGTVLYRGERLKRGNTADDTAAALAVQLIFQDPFSSLNARMRVLDIVGEAPLRHGLVQKADLKSAVADSLIKVGLDPSYLNRYPHQFSGGQRQRIGIARALAVNPKVVVCDESVAALDVSMQAQIVNLFLQLREQLQISLLFISHDLGVVEYLSDTVAVMYLGRIVEHGPTERVFSDPSHPYTRALIEEVPKLHGGMRRFTTIKGEVPSSLSPPRGCHFNPRCPFAMESCKRAVPALKRVGDEHYSACHLNE